MKIFYVVAFCWILLNSLVVVDLIGRTCAAGIAPRDSCRQGGALHESVEFNGELGSGRRHG